MWKKEDTKTGALGRIVISGIVFLLAAYLLTGILLLGLAYGVYRFGMGEKVLAACMAAVYLFSTFPAGFLAGKKAKRRRIFCGLGMGTVYFLILAAISLASGADGGKTGFFPAFLLCCLGGSFGAAVS
ncbi:MAG: TIGR04086 family membrane protein [Lachnospiraceae bacterium]|nr:TIGR04086 family membrane protein [Lachnospiraceae bacterium]